ncbi:MAG: hypothetical protein AAF628_20635 [Planctomycetota bacterium]
MPSRLKAAGRVVAAALVLGVGLGAQPVPGFASRRPQSDAQLRDWLTNMLVDHRFDLAEVVAATGMAPAEIEAEVARLGLPTSPPEATVAEGAPLRVLPWPGGRAVSYRILNPTRRRESKLSVFAPWEPARYALLDLPEGLWSDHGLLDLAHEDEMVDRGGNDLRSERHKLEWDREAPGVYSLHRELAHDISYDVRAVVVDDALRMKITLHNGWDEHLSDLRVQNCVFLKGLGPEFADADRSGQVYSGPYAARGSADGQRWVIAAWVPHYRFSANPRHPCMHSNPIFPDCPPGESRSVYGYLSFYEGASIWQELGRIAATGWHRDRWEQRPAPVSAARPRPKRAARPPASPEELRFWLENMIVKHGYDPAEAGAATGLSPAAVGEAVTRLGIEVAEETAAPAIDAPLRVLPWPGGRWLSEAKPRRRRRESKVSVFAPWAERRYAVLDVPGALWSNFGSLDMAQREPGVRPAAMARRAGARLEWQRGAAGQLQLTRDLGSGIEYTVAVVSVGRSVRMRLTLRNGWGLALRNLRADLPVFLAPLGDAFADSAMLGSVESGPYSARGTTDGKRWVITAWVPHDASVFEAAHPSMASNPTLGVCPPGESRSAYGWFSFYEGGDVAEELRRIDATGWRDDRWVDAPGAR